MDEFIKSANKKQKGQGQKIASPKKIKKKNVSLDKKKARAGYLFVLPFIIGFLHDLSPYHRRFHSLQLQ